MTTSLSRASVFCALALVPLARAAWTPPDAGHRVIRRSPDQGGSSLYFHQNGYTPEGDKLIIHTRTDTPGVIDLATVNLTTLGISPSKLEIVAANTRATSSASTSSGTPSRSRKNTKTTASRKCFGTTTSPRCPLWAAAWRMTCGSLPSLTRCAESSPAESWKSKTHSPNLDFSKAQLLE